MRPSPLPTRAARLLCGATYRDPELFGEALALLEGALGPAERLGDPFAFIHTRYYEAEMGPGLSKRLILFRDPVHPGFLARAKRIACRVEGAFREGGSGGRRINLDPGVLTHASLVLASTKPAAHRIYMGLGIYGETTLMYHGGGFAPLPWTYPDFFDAGVLGFLGEVRRALLDARRDGAR